jgi:Tfp pilus assembly protein PilO
MVLIGIVVAALLGVTWMFLVSPERKEATKVSAQVATAKSALSTAEGQLSGARAAQAHYSSAYASVVSLGKAVPPAPEVPSLIDQLVQASNQKDVEFDSITATSSTSGSSATAAPVAAAAGFTATPFTFIFNGSFFELEQLFHHIDGFATRTASGGVNVSGRLLTIQSVKLAPLTTSTSSAAGSLTGTITATAYQLSASQGLTGAATAASPTGAGASVASTSGAPSSPTAPAIARVNP